MKKIKKNIAAKSQVKMINSKLVCITLNQTI